FLTRDIASPYTLPAQTIRASIRIRIPASLCAPTARRAWLRTQFITTARILRERCCPSCPRPRNPRARPVRAQKARNNSRLLAQSMNQRNQFGPGFVLGLVEVHPEKRRTE